MDRSIVLLAGVLIFAACSDPESKEPGVDASNDVAANDMAVSGTDGGTSDASPDGFCPVVDYSPCGGDLLGTWAFRALCPDDPAAAAALCEHPYDDRAACAGAGNEAVCAGQTSGTLTFNDDFSIEVDTVNTIVATWGFTDDCLAEIKPGLAPVEACADLGTDRLTCAYDASCTCASQPITETDTNTGTYAYSADNEVTLGEDPPATYCVDGDRLTMDYYLFHPVSWRYWVLERP